MEEWQKPETITLWIVITISFLILLLAFIFLLVRAIFRKIIRTKIAESKAKLEHQEKLLETTIKTQEKERKRIAADLHDALIGKLTVLKMQGELTKPKGDSVHLIEECIGIARRISHDLSPPLLEYTSLIDLTKEILHPWEKSIPIIYKYDIREDCTYTNEFKIQFTRIIQELVTNIVKHADANGIVFHFRQGLKGLAVQIVDNGKGFSTSDTSRGLGLQNIETRVQYLGARYRIKSRIEKGTSFLFLFKPKKE
jgi:signal transduction histidine kinase